MNASSSSVVVPQRREATWANAQFSDDEWQRALDLTSLEAESRRTIRRRIACDMDQITIVDSDDETLCYLVRGDNGTLLVISKDRRCPPAAVITLKMILYGYLH